LKAADADEEAWHLLAKRVPHEEAQARTLGLSKEEPSIKKLGARSSVLHESHHFT